MDKPKRKTVQLTDARTTITDPDELFRTLRDLWLVGFRVLFQLVPKAEISASEERMKELVAHFSDREGEVRDAVTRAGGKVEGAYWAFAKTAGENFSFVVVTEFGVAHAMSDLIEVLEANTPFDAKQALLLRTSREMEAMMAR